MPAQIEIYIESKEDLEKLKAETRFRELKYLSDTKKIIGIFLIRIFFPSTEYYYSGTLVTGNASVHKTLDFSIERPEEAGIKQSELFKKAQGELKEIKEEIRELLQYAPRVSVNLNEILARITKAIGK